MPNSLRDAAIKRLRKAAEVALRAAADRRLATIHNEVCPVSGDLLIAQGREKNAMLAICKAWADFPECERDDHIPSPEEIIRLCDSYDRQKAEAERIAAREKEFGTSQIGTARR